MTQLELFTSMEPLLQRLRDSWKTGVISFESQDEKLLLRELYRYIFPRAHVDLTCGTCVKNYLNIMLSFYEREYPKWQKGQKETEVPQILEEDIINAIMTQQKEEDNTLAREQAKEKLSRKEILEKARSARKQNK